MARTVFSIFLPPIIWLLYGSPPLTHMGNLALFSVVMAHLYAVLWQEPVFALFRGDLFTYGFVARGMNIVSLGINLVTCWVTIWRFGGKIETVSAIPSYAWGVIGVSMLFTITIPIFTSRRAIRLPNTNDRRKFEDPSASG